MGEKEEWEFIGAKLGLACASINLPGHGDCEPAEGDWFTAAVRKIEHFLDEERLEQIVLAGYSMGGRIAMQFALKHPGFIKGLVLESANPGLQETYQRDMRYESDKSWSERFKTEWPDILTDWYDQTVFSSLRGTPLLRDIINEKQTRDGIAMAAAITGYSLGKQVSMWDGLSVLDSPILFVSGALDEKYTRIGSELALTSAEIEHVNVEEAGHIVHKEQEEAYLGALQRFIEQFS